VRREISLVLAAVAAYELARRAIHPSAAAAVAHANDVLALERRLGVAWEAPVQHALLPVMPVFDVVYLVAQFGVTALFFLWLYRASPEAYPRFRNAFLVATALALAIQWRYPVAPPRLMGLRDVLHLSVASVTDPLAAMPSLHAGWAVGVGAGVWRRSRVAAVAYPTLVVLATLATGNHYVLDAAAGAGLMGLGFWLSSVIRLQDAGTMAAASRGGAVR
jgi:hypothetical protein